MKTATLAQLADVSRSRAVPRTRQALTHANKWPWPAICLVVVALIVWQVVVAAFSVPTYILPPPTDIARNMFSNWQIYTPAILSTVKATALGFLLAAAGSIAAAGLIVSVPFMDRLISPLLVAIQLVPKIALAPLFIVWFGFGTLPKVLLVVAIAFFPIVIDAVVGLSSLTEQKLALFKSMRATRWQILWKLRIPAAIPSIIGGLKVAVTLAVIGAVVAEFVGSTLGLGAVLSAAQGNLDTTTMFGAIVWLTLIGWAFYLMVVLLEMVAGRRK